ncbi:TadE/TadG family type IV pilus assembly protein [Achromobacter kerstersii]
MTQIAKRPEPFGRQRGQAVVEAMLMMPLMGVLIWAVSWVGGLQFSAQQMSQASRKAAMAAALGQPLGSRDAMKAIGLNRRVEALTGVAAQQVALLQDEWFGGELQLLSVHAHPNPNPNPRAPHLVSAFAAPITRYTRVAVGPGYAHGDKDARHRIANAPTAWRQAELLSVAQARRFESLVARMDGPWGRPSMQTDWLSAWADVVPGDRLNQKRGQAK